MFIRKIENVIAMLLCTLLWAGTVKAADEHTLSAAQIVFEYGQNEIAADARYKGKRVIISGNVQDIGNDVLGHAYVMVGLGMMNGIQCSFPDSRKSSLMRLTKWQHVTVEGTITGKMIFVQMKNAKLIDQETHTITPQEFMDKMR